MDIVIRKRKSKTDSKGIATKKTHRRAAACVEVTSEHLYRRAYSEMTLLDLMGEFNWKEGQSYHFITGGDIDGLSYLKAILRQQPLEHCILSTWRMSGEDILDVQNFVESGKIKKLDLYIGEVFPSSYKIEMGMLRDLYANDGEKMGGGRLAVFRNHSKICAGIGPKFAFGYEGSMNINTNPRTEQCCVTINRGLYDFYKEFFDGINSFEYGEI